MFSYSLYSGIISKIILTNYIYNITFVRGSFDRNKDVVRSFYGFFSGFKYMKYINPMLIEGIIKFKNNLQTKYLNS